MAMKSNKKRYGTHVTTHTGKRVYLSGGSRKELADKVAQAPRGAGRGRGYQRCHDLPAVRGDLAEGI